MLLLFAFNSGHSQSKNQSLYRVQVTTHNGLQLVGVLTHLGDSALQFVPLTQFNRRQLIGEPVLHSYPVKEIFLLKIRKNGAVARTALISGVIGFAAGSLLGWITYEDPCASSTSSWGCLDVLGKSGTIAAVGISGATVGAVIGALAGSGNTRYYLRGDFENYRQMRSELSQYVYSLPIADQR
ncbi:hypothetical protein C8E01_103130 [Pontibacter virosus]|uniref:Uncharacterized protein n=1 Tax=Pontibacter virosus TaxID=1765052 RepID=A0A2U1B0Q2_9BACT|nr:hypothetical protein C8E01_103130 [Pontibacter virosus]